MNIPELEKILEEKNTKDNTPIRRDYMRNEVHKVLKVMQFYSIYHPNTNSEKACLKFMEELKLIELNSEDPRNYVPTESGRELYIEFIVKFPSKPAQ